MLRTYPCTHACTHACTHGHKHARTRAGIHVWTHTGSSARVHARTLACSLARPTDHGTRAPRAAACSCARAHVREEVRLPRRQDAWDHLARECTQTRHARALALVHSSTRTRKRARSRGHTASVHMRTCMRTHECMAQASQCSELEAEVERLRELLESKGDLAKKLQAKASPRRLGADARPQQHARSHGLACMGVHTHARMHVPSSLHACTRA